jgi:hypothetical protein
MKITDTTRSRSVVTVTLPVETYSRNREREFDAAEAVLATVLALKPRAKLANRGSRKAAR